MSPGGPLRHALLEARGVVHGFGVRGAVSPGEVLRPEQVHGCEVAEPRRAEPAPGHDLVPARADAVVSCTPGLFVGIVTADCLPLLVASEDGRSVAAIHAGWRGLAAGVIAAGLQRLSERSASAALFAVIGPSIGRCCYEVDAPVLEALGARFGAEALGAASEPTRPGNSRVDLAALAEVELAREGIAPARCGRIEGACTRCDGERFHSFRRDGQAAGRLLHFIASRAAPAIP